jgi:site-specific DNA recombinase
MDQVRDLVATGEVAVVLAQDRDRIARKPAYNYLLQEEFEEHGCELKALNDYGDDSPEGTLMRGIQDQFAEYERAKTADRMRRGKLRKAREGKLLRNSRAHYGFKFTSNGNAYVVDEEEMRVVRRIFRDVAAGRTLHAIKRSLEREGVSPPGGGQYWSAPFVRRVVMDDVYKPHTHAEITRLVAERLLTQEVAAQLDDSVPHGVCWFNRHRTTRKRVSVEGSNGRKYRWRSTRKTNPRNQWIAIPVPNAGIPRDIWDAAREIVRQNRSPSKTRLREFWELSGGILYCGGCGKRMRPLASMTNGRLYAYYRCARKLRDGVGSCPVEYDWRAEKVEEAVWELISELMYDPQRLRNGLEQMIERERETMRGDPESETQSWLNKLAEIDRQRARAQDLAIEGLLRGSADRLATFHAY